MLHDGGFVGDNSFAIGGGGRGPDPILTGRIKALEEQISRLRLVNQALWELMRDQHGLDKYHLEQKIEEIDARDGRVDGRIADSGLRCPQCGRISNSKHGKCLYCGLEFERDTVV